MSRLKQSRLTQKQQEFARLVAEGSSLAKAYRTAYDTSAGGNTVRVEACRLARHPGIAEKINQLKKAAAAARANPMVGAERRLRELRSTARSLGLSRRRRLT
jgi:hypothetical protein